MNVIVRFGSRLIWFYILVGCANWPPAYYSRNETFTVVEQSTEEAAIREAVLWYYLKPPGQEDYSSYGFVCVSIDTSRSSEAVKAAVAEPDSLFLKRFSDYPFPLLTPSCSSLRLRNGRSAKGRLYGLYDDVHGGPGARVHIGEIVWQSTFLVTVDTYLYWGPLAATGFRMTLEKQETRWVIRGVTITWIS